jgi:hypothetical protein
MKINRSRHAAGQLQLVASWAEALGREQVPGLVQAPRY